MPSPSYLHPDGAPAPRRGTARTLAAEAASVLAAGSLVAALANTLSPRGLSWTRDYFPAGTGPVLVAPTAPEPPVAGTSASPAAAEAAPGVSLPTTDVNGPSAHSAPKTASRSVTERLRQRGLTPVTFDEVVQHFEDPRREAELIVFVDARKDDRYQEGHIPGAYPLDHYYPDQYLPQLLPACQTAEVVVVYCTGGTCEDSEHAAVMLTEAGIPADRVKVYPGGIEEWKTRGRTMEHGPRGSGDIRTTP